jgi:flavodoxin
MKKAVIAYLSETGITHDYADQIGNQMKKEGIHTIVTSIRTFHDDMLNEADYLLLGTWTNGLFVAFQHPDREWIEFAKKLPHMDRVRVGLFTTYKFATGSMFRNMKKHLPRSLQQEKLLLKSKNGKLSRKDAEELGQFIRE